MIKVLIVDDEMLVRLTLRKVVKWEESGYKLIGEAEDGIEALKIIESEQPEIVLTDIRMPNMDGLELIKNVKRSHPKIKFFILSCLDDFDFVRQGMKLGAYDYIPKLSMKPEELLNTLDRIKADIIKERVQASQFNSMKTQLNRNKSIIKDNLFDDIINKNILDQKNFSERCAHLNINLEGPYYYLILLDIDCYEKVKDKLESSKLLQFAIGNILDEIIDTSKVGAVFKANERSFVIVISFNEEVKEQYYYYNAIEIAKEAKDSIKSVLDISISASISGKVEDYKNLKEAYKQGHEALTYAYYSGPGSLCRYSGIKKGQSDSYLKEQSYKDLMKAIEGLSIKEAIEHLNEFGYWLKYEQKLEPRQARKLIGNIGFLFQNKCISYGESFLTDVLGFDLVTKNRETESLEEIISIYSNAMQKIEDAIEERRGSGCLREISFVKDYVYGHFNEEITVGKMSQLVNMNPDYFSHLFKKTVGKSFTEYLTTIRMEQAKLLLKMPDIKVYEVSEAVGYSNVNYFSKTFKKIYGISPAAFMKSLEM